MANPSRDKGNAYEWDLVNWAARFLGDVASPLAVERTRAGYQRDWGDVLVLAPDRSVLATWQAKNRREWNLSAWVDQMVRQQAAVRARFGALLVKRSRVGDVGRSYAILPANEYVRLLAALYAAESQRCRCERLTELALGGARTGVSS